MKGDTEISIVSSDRSGCKCADKKNQHLVSFYENTISTENLNFEEYGICIYVYRVFLNSTDKLSVRVLQAKIIRNS
jgi:hypothetical protein